MSTEVRAALPPMPRNIASLPIDRGYPVPWFVAWLSDDTGYAVRRGEGRPDFRVLYPHAIETASALSLCWICGKARSKTAAFVIGPMCAVNRVSAEPPSHAACADWAARACPFLTMPKMVRREKNLPGGHVPPAGLMLKRNPGVALVWTSDDWRQLDNDLFDVGNPIGVSWYAEGRPATRSEILKSIESGLPVLMDHAPTHDDRVALALALDRAKELIPA